MIIEEIDTGIKISDIKSFSLEETFECGQCFRWDKIDDKYRGIAFHRVIYLYYKENDLIIEHTTLEEFNSIWREYFDLDRNYDTIRKDLSKVDPILLNAGNFCPGIRILNQDPWETLCSFIISQNNNIPRIKGIISRLCESFGDKILDNLYSFPSAKRLERVTLDDLKVIRSGFRAGYILDAAKKISNNEVNLDDIKLMSLNKARETLMSIKGVGPKVAECELLYGFHRLDAFPIDIWMKRVMNEYFPGKSPSIFGEYAGIAQQYLFHYTRTTTKNLK